MAQYYILANRNAQEKDWTVSTGAPPALTADQVCLTFDRTTNLTRGDLYQFIEKLERFIPKNNFPPV